MAWSIRPFFVRLQSDEPDKLRRSFLYPFANYEGTPSGRHFDLFNLVRLGAMDAGADRESRYTEVWPFYFARRDPREGRSYRALFPIAGTIRNRFFYEEINFLAFPLYLITSSREEVTTSAPWPFVRWRTGPDTRGFALWPLFGAFEREERYRHRYALWPLIYDYRDYPAGPDTAPYHRLGVLPFYARETAPGMRSKTFLWPFFGYTREWDPRPEYRERRLFWPFVVQGRGEERHLERWWPLYSYRRGKDFERRWLLWPLYRSQQTHARGITADRRQILYFLYWDERQTPIAPDAADFRARRTHLWPLFSYWNDGRESRQFQALSPMEVFFPWNELVREKYSPLFALYRYDARPGGDVHHSILFNLITLQRGPDSRHTQIGPIIEFGREGYNRYLHVLKGLVGYERRREGTEWRFLWMDR